MEVELQNIINGCKQYQKFAQKLLYDRFAPEMNGLCLRYVIDHVIAKKIVQSGFIEVFSNIKRYNNEQTFEIWIKQIFIKNTLMQIRDTHKKEMMYDLLDTTEAPLTIENNVGSFKIPIDIDAIDLLEILNNLPVTYRIIFNLLCIDNFNHDKVAKLLGIDPSLSEEMFSKARRMVYQEIFKIRGTNNNTSRQKSATFNH